ncbi:SND2/TMEM208 family protein [bacterium]|jgi:hypothetical protein|nr:SND2/TMEM208 family protein [bacterium]|tara:strand:- start:2375 stop:2914 length:540 start_codon:yes stop_codon:yes gene_type:complete
MAGGKAKQRAEANVSRLSLLRNAFFTAIGVHVLVRLVLYRASTWYLIHYPLFATACFCSWFCYRSLAIVGTPSWDASGVLIDGGGDLTLSGLSSYYHDIIYVSVFCLLASALVSDWFWLLYLSIPGFATYKLWADYILPWVFTPTADEADAISRQNETKEQRKKREKQEKRAENRSRRR